jgi:hypothetical protein
MLRALRPAIPIALAILVLPAGASAKGIFDTKHRSETVTMSVHGSHGYRIAIEGHTHGRVRLTVSKHSSAAEYTVPGRIARHRLRANFGRLGRISVRFHRVGEPRPGRTIIPLKCKGRPPLREPGRFEGTIRFRGERGFTSVAVHGAWGSVVRRFKRSCALPRRRGRRRASRAASASGFDSIFVTALAAAERRKGRTVALSSVGFETPPNKRGESLSLTLVDAGLAERRGRIAIRRQVLIDGDQGTVLASPLGAEPITATVILPSPFAGTGSYFEEAGSRPRWTGSLRVRLPGADRVPLTGPHFTAALCRGHGEKVLRCLEEFEENLPRLMHLPHHGVVNRSVALLRAMAPTPSPWLRRGSPPPGSA